MRQCLKCQVDISHQHRQNRFCSKSCSAKYNNEKRGGHSVEHRKKISDGLKKYAKEHPSKRSSGETHSKAVGASTSGKYKVNIESIYDVSSRTRSKIIRRLYLKCVICGWDDAAIDVHHIIPKRAGGSDDMSNLIAVCPNHHRSIHAGKVEIPVSSSLLHTLPPNWKDVYYG